jgi:TonB-dependent receptor
MHTCPPPAPPARALRRLVLGLASLTLGLLTASAQAPATGGLAGQVMDASTKAALSGARIAVDGTNVETFADQQGNYQLPNLPAGPIKLNVSYVGYPAQTLTGTIVAGQTTRLDAVFASEVFRLDTFRITGSVVGTARAINDQRAAPALTNIISADSIGQLPDKNVAESLQRVPGVDIARDKGEGRFVIIRGLDPVYIGTSMNGIRMSTAEKGTRQEALDVMSSTLISTIEVNKVNTPDMDTDDMGGSVNVKTRSGFDQEGRQEMVQVGTNYGHQEDRHGGYNLATNYADQYLGGQVGFALDLASEARPFTTYSEPGTTWSLAKSPTDGQQHWILASQDFRHYDAKRWRQGIGTGLDFKISPTETAYVRYLYSNYTEKNQQWLTTFPFGAGTIQQLTDTSATVSIKANGIIKSEAQIVNNKRISSLVGGLDSILGSWKNNLEVGYTTGKYTRPTLTIAFANTAATVVSYNFDTPYNNTVAQVSGPSLDSPASYAFSTKSGYSNTTANMHEETVKDGLRYDLPDAPNPTYVKVGVEYRNKNNNLDTSKWNITGAPFTLASVVYPGNDIQDTAGGFGNFQIRQEAVQSFYSNQGAFPQSLAVSTTYGGAFQALEDIGAAYVMGGITLGQLKLTAGARLEDTHFDIHGWQYDSTTAVVTPVTTKKHYDNVLPGIIAEYELTPNDIARASWTNTIARPDYNATAPGRTVDDVNHLVTQGNAQLDALQAMNWDASLEHYYSHVGVVSAAVFYKSIKNFTYQLQSGTDPQTGYLLTTYYNGPSAWIYGLELNWAQQLNFLPGFLSGLGLQANTVLGSSQAKYPFRPGEKIPFTGYGHDSGNVALTYNYAGLSLRVAEHFHSRRLESSSVIGANSTQDEYEEPYHELDASASYTWHQHWQVYLLGANLNNAPLKEYYGGTGNLHRIQTFEVYGWGAEGGIRWTY